MLHSSLFVLCGLQVKKKMEEVEFCRNLRGVNDGKDFPKEFLSHIYHSICSGEAMLCMTPAAPLPRLLSRAYLYCIAP
jgi:brefeldin A-resistance guanine nucleotide exchange factor 1